MPAADESDKAPAAKPAAVTTTSFINKNSTGKKHVPKGIRRRPAATDAASAPPPAPKPPTPAVDAEPPAAHAANQQEQQLPTPAPTQELGPQHVPPVHDPATSSQHHGDTPPERPTKKRRIEEPFGTTGAHIHTTSDTTAAGELHHPPPASVQPWVPVNQQTLTTDSTSPNPPSSARTLPKPRGKRKAADPSLPDHDAHENDAQPYRTRGKRQTNAGSDTNGSVPPAPIKRTRKLRRGQEQGVADNTIDTTQNDQDGPDEAPAIQRRKPRKPRQPRKSKMAAPGSEPGQDGEQPAPVAGRKGRPPREPTPEDAEDHVINPDTTFMDSLASRNIRVGKLSVREREMRKIDWVAVKQRRREEDRRHVSTKQTREQEDRIAAEQLQSAELNPRYQLVNGNIELVPESAMVDREANADREIETYETIEEQDLTTRITSRSFMKNNKRFPNEFILPGQGKRWTTDETALFYQGLRSFGTDFQMISRMFPGSTRRSIKTKFTREERENPDDVREALLGKSEMTQHWNTFLEAAKIEEDSFADADEIKRQLAEEESEWRERIAAATAETLERKRQQREAGLLDEEGAENEAGNKENGKGKRKKKDKERHVAFEQEEGVEILGDINDDDTWGQE